MTSFKGLWTAKVITRTGEDVGTFPNRKAAYEHAMVVLIGKIKRERCNSATVILAKEK